MSGRFAGGSGCVAPVAVRELAVERIDEPGEDVRRRPHAAATAREGPEAVAREQELDRRPAGWSAESLPSKQSPPAEGAASARSARPLLRTRLSRTSFPPEGQKFVSTIGIIAMPYVAWSSTRFPTIRFAAPAGDDDAHAERDVLVLLRVDRGRVVVVDVVAGDHDVFAVERTARSRACSGTIPARFSRHSLFTIARFPPAFVPENPRALCSASTSVITASHGLHAPM